MLVSTNRTHVQFLAVETVASAEAIDLLLNAPLLRLEPRKLGLPLGEGTQVLGDKRAHGATLLRRANSCGAVNIVGNGNGDVRHCGAQYRRHTADSLGDRPREWVHLRGGWAQGVLPRVEAWRGDIAAALTGLIE